MHGYGIAVRIEQMSKGVFRLNAGSLFVAIQRLQRDGPGAPDVDFTSGSLFSFTTAEFFSRARGFPECEVN
jgi:hypothetical protein